MFHLSRALYRKLAPLLEPVAGLDELQHRRQALLDACEATLDRLTTDPDYFSRPARYLFAEIRPLFGICNQLAVRVIVDREIGLAVEAIAQERALQHRDCAAHTRRGTPCRREPVAGSEFCPSHRHLEAVLRPSAAQIAAERDRGAAAAS